MHLTPQLHPFSGLILIGFEPFCIRLGHAYRKLGILDEYVQKNTVNLHWAGESVQIRSALRGHLYQKCVLSH